jgi:nucleoside-diphosphate-sugar epimerase
MKGDIRDERVMREAAQGCDAVIHLACISNDPSVQLDPALSRSVNFECFGPLVRACKRAGARRFVHASSSSVYGVSDAPEVREDHPLVPISLYNQFKAMCEPVLLEQGSPDFVPVIVRPATLCGHSPRQRLDLTVNILTAHAVHDGTITIFGGTQLRPNLHILDMVDLYSLLLKASDGLIAGEVFNAGYQNHTVAETAAIVRAVVQREMPEKGEIALVATPSDDPRSYHVSSEKVRRKLGFVPRRTIEDGARDLVGAFRAGLLPDAMSDVRYYNIRMMKALNLR